MTKPELEKRIFLHLSKIPFSTFDEMRQIFKCTKNDLIEIIEKNTKTDLEPLGFILVDRKKSPTHIPLNQQIMIPFIFK